MMRTGRASHFVIDQDNLEENLANTEPGGVANVEYALEDAQAVIKDAGM